MKATIAIAGGGPAALFLYKRFVESNLSGISISIFEKNARIGAGMPYSPDGACAEHITNVSGNEIPTIVTSMRQWIAEASPELLAKYKITPENFNDYKVVPRLLFGEYLAAQFELLKKKAVANGIDTKLYLNTTVQDAKDDPIERKVILTTDAKEVYAFDALIICTGHRWPKIHEGKVPGWFDSPYPPAKLKGKYNFPIAITGASLTAIDAVRTIARENGTFTQNKDHTLTYQLHDGSKEMKILLHSIDGLLPAIRFHLQDTHLSTGPAPLTQEEIHALLEKHNGFVPLDFLFERNFMQPLKERNPDFYEQVKDMNLEIFTAHVMSFRKNMDAFQLFQGEYAEAEKSIKRHESVYWKEILAELSYAMNYPAKHLSAEDMLRLKKVIMPLISIIIAFVPQSSARELMALYAAGVLDVVAVDPASKTEPQDEGAMYIFKDAQGKEQRVSYKVMINAIGQPPFMYREFIFPTLVENGTVSAASLRFASVEAAQQELEKGNDLVFHSSPGEYYLKVPGININDHFQVLDLYGIPNDRIYIMAVPYIAGLNPDYSGLDFCENASQRIVNKLLETDLES